MIEVYWSADIDLSKWTTSMGLLETTELEIYRRALQRIADLDCASCERYVAEADAIAIDALVMGESAQQEAHQFPLPKAA